MDENKDMNKPEEQDAKSKDEAKEQTKPEAKYSDEDLDRIIAKKFADWKAKEEKAVKEAERLAKLSAEEKANEERDAAIKRAEDAERKLSRLNLAKEARTILSADGVTISDVLLDVLVSEDADSTKANISAFVKMYKADVEAAVKERIAGKAPKSGGKASMTKEQIMAIKDNATRHKAIRENIDLFTK